MERTFNPLLFMASCWLEHLVNYVRFKSLKEPKYNLVSSVVEPRVPEAFLARFPVAAYVLYCDPRVFFSRGTASRSLRRLCLWPISPDTGKKKTSPTQGTVMVIVKTGVQGKQSKPKTNNIIPESQCYLQWTITWAYAWTSWVTLFLAVHLYRCPFNFLVTFVRTKVFPWCNTVLFPAWVQMMFDGGLLVALQKKLTLLYSTTVWLLGAETMTAGSRELKYN